MIHMETQKMELYVSAGKKHGQFKAHGVLKIAKNLTQVYSKSKSKVK